VSFRGVVRETRQVTQQVDEYLASVDEPKRSTLTALRRTILDLLPNAEECISYGMPAYKVQGKTIAGFAAFKNHLSYLPHSGSVLEKLADQLGSFAGTKGSLHFPVDEPLPRELIRQLLQTRLTEAGVTVSLDAERSGNEPTPCDP
jgi:uncharacterized protein YdhG (YjbR/CyaY superfamily)